MTNRERMQKVLNGESAMHVPVIEWAAWWNQTIDKWHAENSSIPTNQHDLYDYFGLDMQYQFWLSPNDGQLPPPAYHGAPVISNEKEFEAALPHLFSEQKLTQLHDWLRSLKEKHERGECSIWYSLEGFFWFPRTLFGIENHLYAFYDYPELMLEMNNRLVEYYKKAIDVIYDVLTPEFMTLAEDMSYNHGPMISKDLYDEFMAPFYNEIIPIIKKRGTKVLIDTDGDVEPLIPWFSECGIEGVLPLERQAGVDVNRIRANYPDWIMIGGYDKTVMHLGEAAMRKEFERILPAIKSGRYIPSVDHQTPPDVSLENYKIFVKLLKEYSKK